jgi:hypothetical protein
MTAFDRRRIEGKGIKRCDDTSSRCQIDVSLCRVRSDRSQASDEVTCLPPRSRRIELKCLRWTTASSQIMLSASKFASCTLARPWSSALVNGSKQSQRNFESIQRRSSPQETERFHIPHCFLSETLSYLGSCKAVQQNLLFILEPSQFPIGGDGPTGRGS